MVPKKSQKIKDANMGYLPPMDKDAEEVVLGALLSTPKAIHLVHSLLKSEAFYFEQNNYVCEAILGLYRAERPVDAVSVKHELSRSGKLEMIGGYFRLIELMDRVASSANIGEHIAIINYTYQLRELIRLSSDIRNKAFDITNDPFTIIKESVTYLDGLKNLNVRRTEKAMREMVKEMLADIRKPKVDGLLGLSSGSKALDSVTKGWQKGQLIIPAGRPAMGKTADLCSQVAHIGYILKKPVGVFSLEMTSLALTYRIASNLSEIPQLNLKLNNLSEIEDERLLQWIDKLAEAPIYMDDTAGINIDELEAKATIWKSLYGIEILFIDYLQLINVKGSRPGNREGDVSDISKRLKALAKTLEIPIVALCQLSRAVESRDKDNYLPKLSDLRESGSIEQDADVVYFLWRPEYYDLKQTMTFPKFNLSLDPANLIIKKVAKCREEEPGLIPGKFTGNIMKVSDHPRYLDKINSPELPIIGTGTIKPPTDSNDDDEPPF